MNSNFIDYIKIFCRSGNGGAGSMHYDRSKQNPRGGPDGGDGGRGGHIILKGNKQLWTLLHLRYSKHMHAEHGFAGGKSLATGANGKDIILEVPVGTIARDVESEEIICEITEHGQEEMLVEGGMGGRGNDHFKSPTNRSPQYAQPGSEGTEGWKSLELKLLADVGLVGFPNAGKSTLLASISAAKPKIASYPFTTLEPNLGIVAYREFQSFVMADIPGIIEGAHEGKGIGLRFLRHIERNSVLLFMIPADSEDPKHEYHILLNELNKYNSQLMHKDRIVTISKSDLLDEDAKKKIKKEMAEFNPVIFSAVSGEGIPELKDKLWNLINTPS